MTFKSICIVLLCLCALTINGQNDASALAKNTVNAKKSKTVLRPYNVFTAAIGSAIANGDLPEAQFDLNFQIGFKRFLSPSFNIGLSYSKFNIVFEDIYNEGFMSFDLDFEYVVLPERKFSPYIYIGPGFNAANGLEDLGFKFQAGVGVEYLVSENLGLKLYGDRSFLSNDILDGLEAGRGNDSYYKMGFGVNFYLNSNARKKVNEDEPSFIKQNKLDDF